MAFSLQPRILLSNLETFVLNLMRIRKGFPWTGMHTTSFFGQSDNAKRQNMPIKDALIETDLLFLCTVELLSRRLVCAHRQSHRLRLQRLVSAVAELVANSFRV